MRLLFENRSQAKKVRWLTLGFIVWTLPFLFWAWSLAHTYGLSPGDGGLLRPAHERLTVAGLIALCGVLPTAGMWFFSRHYVLRIERDADEVRLTVLGMLQPFARSFNATDFVRTSAQRSQKSGPTPANTWIALRVAGQPMPFVVDLQAEQADLVAINALVSAPAATRRQERGRRKKQSRIS